MKAEVSVSIFNFNQLSLWKDILVKKTVLDKFLEIAESKGVPCFKNQTGHMYSYYSYKVPGSVDPTKWNIQE
jgi:hypothetical protein